MGATHPDGYGGLRVPVGALPASGASWLQSGAGGGALPGVALDATSGGEGQWIGLLVSTAGLEPVAL